MYMASGCKNGQIETGKINLKGDTEMKKKRLEEPILAEGEATGHAHRVVSKRPVEVYELSSGIREFVAKESVEVVHEEHGKIGLLPDKYYSGSVEEYDHFNEEARKVKD